MRISDWSSDVCSSDLTPLALGVAGRNRRPGAQPGRRPARASPPGSGAATSFFRSNLADHCFAIAVTRSEEHTSELQSLMRISYAVFCLKKKTNNNKKHYSTK